MELYQLRTFVAVANEGNLTKAAKRLNVSQPAISSQIKMLEEELGVALFVRGARGMRLTQAGRMLVEEAERALRAAHDFVSRAQGMNAEIFGSVRLLSISHPITLRLGEFLATLCETHPRIAVSLRQAITGEVIERLKQGEVDAGWILGAPDIDGISVFPLAPVVLDIVGPVAWADKLNAASLCELSNMTWAGSPQSCSFHRFSDLLFKAGGGRPHVPIESDQEDMLERFANSGFGLTLLRRDRALVGLDNGHLAAWPGGYLRTCLSFVTRDESRTDTRIMALRAICRQVWPERYRLPQPQSDYETMLAPDVMLVNAPQRSLHQKPALPNLVNQAGLAGEPNS